MEVIEDPEVDAVWICSPSQYHADQIKAAAANGKHVFCEKPIATDLGETVEAINACNAAGVKLMIGLQRRFDQNFMRVRQAVQQKEVGAPIQVRTIGNWKTLVSLFIAQQNNVFNKRSSHSIHPMPFYSMFFESRSSCARATPHRHPLSMSREAAVSSLIWRSMTLT